MKPFYCKKCGWKVTACRVRKKKEHNGLCCGCIQGIHTDPDQHGLAMSRRGRPTKK